MADKTLNAVTTAKDGSYIYAEDASGNQIKISKADLATVVAGVMSANRLFDFNYLGNLQASDLNDVGNGFGYAYGINDNSGVNGIFVSFNVMNFKLQIKADMVTNGVIKYRKYNQSTSTWSEWFSLI